MDEIKFKPKSDEDIKEDIDDYFLVEHGKGDLKCSCGRELIKQDSETYKCSGGYPQWRIQDNEVRIDKFGNILLKAKNHGI